MKKEIKDLKINRKKLCLILAIILTIIIIILNLIFINSKKEKSLDLSDFEKVGVYNYLESEFLDYNLLKKFADEPENEIIEENRKVSFAIEYYLKKHDTDKVTNQDLKDTYYNLFGDELKVDIEAIGMYDNMYIYNYEDNTIKKNNDSIQDEKENNYKAKISDIYTKDDEYNVKVDIIDGMNEIESLSSETNKEELEEKVGSAILTLKVENERYIIKCCNVTID